jgi:hypothetical protein
MDLNRFRKLTEGLISSGSKDLLNIDPLNGDPLNVNTRVSLVDILSEAISCFEDEVFLQYGVDEDQSFKLALKSNPYSYAVVIQEGRPINVKRDESLESRVMFCSDSPSICLEDFFSDDQTYRIGSVFVHDPFDYRHLLLLFATIKNYLADKALIVIDHCTWGSIQQAAVDLMLLYPTSVE